MTRAASPLRGRVVFVVGAPRSGTNWMQRVLAAHPDVVAVPSETYLFSHGLQPLLDRLHHGSLSSSQTGSVYVERDAMLDSLRDLCDTVFGGLIEGIDPAASWIVERTPEHVKHVGLIGDVYPDAWVIHIIRDGRDVVRSQLSQEWGPSQAREGAEQWASEVRAARDDGKRLDRYIEVRYEEMLAAPAAVIGSLFERLGLHHTADMGAVLAEAGSSYNADPSAPSVAAGKWRTGLSAEAIDAVLDAAGDLLAELGYTEDEGAPPPAPAPAAPQRTGPRRPSWLRRLRSDGREQRRLLTQGQIMMNTFIDGARSDDPTVLEPMLATDLHVRIVAGADRFAGRGPAARRRLLDELRADKALRGKQLFGYVHPSLPDVMYVGEFEHDGTRHARMLALTILSGTVNRVAYYAYPPAHT